MRIGAPDDVLMAAGLAAIDAGLIVCPECGAASANGFELIVEMFRTGMRAARAIENPFPSDRWFLACAHWR